MKRGVDKFQVFALMRRYRSRIALIVLAVGMGAFGYVPRAYAGPGVSLPLVDNNGNYSCPTCVTESAPTSHGVVVQGSGQELSVVGPDASSTKVLCSQGSSSDPTFCSLTLSFIPSDTASNWAAKIGTPTGSGEFVRATSPTIASPTITTGFTATGLVHIGDLASSDLKGTSGATKVATSTSGSFATNDCAKFDANGNIVSANAACGTNALAAIQKDVSPLTQLTVASGTPVYCGLDGSCSTTASDIQSPYSGSGTYSAINCFATTGTTNAVKVEVFSGTCNGTMATGTLTETMSATAFTQASSSGSTAFVDGNCVQMKFSAVSTATKAAFRCTIKQTAGA